MDPFTIAAIVAALGSAGVSYANTQSTAKRRRTAIDEQYANSQKFGREAQSRLRKTVDQFEPDERDADVQIASDENLGILNRLSDANKANRQERPEVSGKVSEAFSSSQAKRRLGTNQKAGDRNLALARLFGIQSGGSLADNRKMASLSNDLSTVRGNRRGQFGADQNAVNLVQRNSTMDLISGILKGVSFASGAAGGAAGGLTSSTGSNTATASQVAGLAPLQAGNGFSQALSRSGKFMFNAGRF